MFALAIAMGIGRFAYTPILPWMLDGAGLTLAGAGWLASANFAGYLAGALAVALPLFRTRRAGWVVLALVTSAATTLAMGLTSSYAAWLALRTASGIASAFVLVLTSSIVLDALARRNASARAWLLYAGVGTGIAFSALGVDLVARATGGGSGLWATLWLALGTGALAAALWPALTLWRTDRETAPTHAASRISPAATTPQAAPMRPLLRMVVSYGLFGFGYVVTATFVVAMARDGGADRTGETLVWLAVGLCALPSVLAWNAVAARTGLREAYVLAILVEAAGVAMTALLPGTAALVAGAGLLGGTFVAVTALGLMHVRALVPEATQRAVALMTASFAAGQMVGPSVAALMAERTGTYTHASLLAAAALVAAALLATRR